MGTFSMVEKTKRSEAQMVELSVELGPYILAYKNYKNILENQGGSTNSLLERVHKATYETLRTSLLDGLSPLTGGCFSDVFDLAMESEKLTGMQSKVGMVKNRIQYNYNESLKSSAAYEAMEDSFVEILKNTVDETIAKHFASSDSRKPINTIKAILNVCIDDKTSPGNISISCTDNGRGFKQEFIEQTSTLDSRQTYISNFSSNKLSEARALSSDIPLFTGGRGLGLRLLMQKIDEGTCADSEPDRKHARLYKARVSDIVLSNKTDSLGKIKGAVITITTSKQPVLKEDKEQIATLNPRELMQQMKKTNQENRQTSPTSLAMDFDFLNDTSDDDSYDLGSASPN